VKKIAVKSLLIFLLVFVQNGFAQTANNDSILMPAPTSIFNEQEFSDVVVTGQYAPTSSKNATYKVNVISNTELTTRGVTNLREALQNQVGIDLAQDNVYGSSVSINGISGEGVKILVNGVPMVGRIDGKIDISQINLTNVERIEIVKGPQSVIYGTDALGGVINIITKEQKDEWNVTAKGLYETVGQYNFSVGGGFKKKNWSFSADAGRNFFDGYSPVDTSRNKQWRPKEQYLANLRVGYQKNKLKTWVELAFFRELMIDRGDIRPRTTQAFDTHFLTYRPGATLGMSYAAKKDWQIDLTMGYSGFVRYINSYVKEMTTLQETLRPTETQDTTVFHNINIRPVALKVWKKHALKLLTGFEINHIWSTQNRISGGSRNMGDYAIYGSMQYTGVKNLELQPALRVLYNTQFKFSAIPSFNIKYNATKWLTIRGTYAMGYRAPSLKELYINFKDSNHDINGNENLKAESSQHGGLSIELSHQTKKTSLSLSNNWNYNYITNKIDLAIQNPNSIPMAYQYFNIRNYTAFTGDHEFQVKAKRFHVGVGAIYQYSRVATDTKTTANSLWSIDYTAKAGYTIPVAEISLDVWYKYTGKKLLYVMNNSVQTGTRNGFHQLNISASHGFWKERIVLTVGGKNLLNVRNVQSDNVSGVGHNFNANSSLVAWGTTFFTSLNFKFSK